MSKQDGYFSEDDTQVRLALATAFGNLTQYSNYKISHKRMENKTDGMGKQIFTTFYLIG